MSEKALIIVLVVNTKGLIKNLANIVKLKNQKNDDIAQFFNKLMLNQWRE